MARPRKYRPQMLDEVLLSAADGATWQAIGEACGIDPATAKDWCNEAHETYCAAFHAAVTRAKDKADDIMLTSLFHSGMGYQYEEQVAIPGVGVETISKRKHGEVAAQKSWLANRIGWRGETSRVEADDPMLAVFAALRQGDADAPAVPEAG